MYFRHHSRLVPRHREVHHRYPKVSPWANAPPGILLPCSESFVVFLRQITVHTILQSQKSLEQKAAHKSDSSTRGLLNLRSRIFLLYYLGLRPRYCPWGNLLLFPRFVLSHLFIHQEVISSAPKRSKSHRDESCPFAVLESQKDFVRNHQMSTLWHRQEKSRAFVALKGHKTNSVLIVDH